MFVDVRTMRGTSAANRWAPCCGPACVTPEYLCTRPSDVQRRCGHGRACANACVRAVFACGLECDQCVRCGLRRKPTCAGSRACEVLCAHSCQVLLSCMCACTPQVVVESWWPFAVQLFTPASVAHALRNIAC